MEPLSAAERVYQRWGYPLPPLAGADDGPAAPAAPPASPTAQPETAPPAAVPVPPVQTPPAAPAAPAPANPGPWAADLERYFPDETSRQAADRFMREYVQPARTQLEQELAPMRELYQDLVSDPRTTLAAVAQELFADEQSEYHDAGLAEKLAGIFGGDPDAPAAPPAGDPPQIDQVTLDKLPAEVREIVEERIAQRSNDEYNTAVDAFIAQSENLTPEDKDALGPWISATNGDLQAAEQALLNYKQQLLAAAGVQPAVPAPTVPVLGSEAVTPTGAPPAEKKYASLDDALDDFVKEQRQGPVPPVGAV